MNVQIYKENHGFGLHVSNNMMRAYIKHNKLDMDFKPRMAEYASMIAEKHLQDNKSDVLSIDIAESCIKQSICFEALKQAQGVDRLSKNAIDILHQQSYELAQHISETNIHMLNNKELMREAVGVVQSSIKAEFSYDADRLIQLNKEELIEQQKEIQLHTQKEFCIER